MAVYNPTSTAYGLSQALINVFPPPIISQRNPTTADKATIGTVWINTFNDNIYMITRIVDNIADWVLLSSSGGTVQFIEGNSGGPVGPNAAYTINVVGDGSTINIVGNPATNTLTVSTIDSVATSYDTDVGDAVPIGGVLNIISGLSLLNCGSTVRFTGLSNTVELFVTNSGHNTIIGKLAGTIDTTTTNNTGLGYEVLSEIATSAAIGNTALGATALNVLTTGADNTALGFDALVALGTGSNNIAIGSGAGSNYIGAEGGNIIIGNTGVTSESDTIRIGTTGTQTSAYMAGVANVSVSNINAVTIDTTTGQLGSEAFPSSGIQTIDGDSGSVTGSTVSLNAQFAYLTTLNFNGSGTQMNLGFRDSNFNIMIGGGPSITSGSSNVSYGNTSGSSLSSGSWNTLIGTSAASTLTTGSQNVFVGGNQSPRFNVANTVAVGYQAAANLFGTACTDNIAIGYQALFNADTSSGSNNYNIGIGSQTLFQGGNTGPSSYNIAIGYQAGNTYNAAESNNILLNNNGTNNESNALHIGAGTGTGNQQLNKAFISGINGNTVSNTRMVTIDSSTDQLGTATIPSSGITITGDSGGGLTGNSFTFTGASTGLTFAGAGTTETLSGTLAIANGGTNSTSFTQTNGITTYNGTRLVNYAGPQLSSGGIYTNTSQPAFYAYNSAGATNVTGDGTNYTVVFDTTVSNQGSNYNTGTSTFTAPVTGMYFFTIAVEYLPILVAHTTGQLQLAVAGTSASVTILNYINPGAVKGGGSAYVANANAAVKMTATDTATVILTVVGSTKTVGIASGSATNPACTFAGYLVC